VHHIGTHPACDVSTNSSILSMNRSIGGAGTRGTGSCGGRRCCPQVMGDSGRSLGRMR
jgi:hypothetical protein